jgi:hypothetical protein
VYVCVCVCVCVCVRDDRGGSGSVGGANDGNDDLDGSSRDELLVA